MINIKYLTLLLVFSILCCEPAIAVQIGDSNNQNSNLKHDNSPYGADIVNKLLLTKM